MPAEPCAPWHGRRRQERSTYIGREPEPGMLDHENSIARTDFLVTCVWLITRNLFLPDHRVEGPISTLVVEWRRNTASMLFLNRGTRAKVVLFHRNALLACRMWLSRFSTNGKYRQIGSAWHHVWHHVSCHTTTDRFFTCHTGDDVFRAQFRHFNRWKQARKAKGCYSSLPRAPLYDR